MTVTSSIRAYDFSAIPIFLLKLIGVSIVRTGTVYQMKHNFYFYFVCVIAGLTVFQLFMYLRWSSKYPEYFTSSVNSFNHSIFTFIAFLKIYCILQKKFCKLLDQLEILFPKSKAGQIEYKIDEYLTEIQKSMRKYIILNILTITSFSAIPFAMSAQKYFEIGNWEMDFGFNFWYPFDPYRPGIFEVMYVLQAYVGIIQMLMLVISDIFLLSCVNQICIYYDYIKNSFREMKPNSKNAKNDLDLIKKYVELHTETIQ